MQEHEINVAFMGTAKVGKSSIIQRILGNEFVNIYTETVFEYYKYTFRVEGNIDRSIVLNISDTSGAYNFPAMDRLTIQKSNVVILVFDLGNARSFHHVNRLVSEIELLAPTTPIIFVGNKSELKSSATDADEIEDYVMCTLNHAYVEMSAKYDDNVDKLLRRIYEENEISMGPYSVQKGKRNTISRMKTKLSKSYQCLLSLQSSSSSSSSSSLANNEYVMII